ncbi:MAG: alpha-amylase family glycosyl hydrolase [Anaerolineae bacterium]
MLKKVLLLALLVLAGAGLSFAQEAESGVPWWNERVFYEIFVRSFYDSNGDGVGDLRGIIEKLDYLNDGDPTTTDDLGITGIWLMPINPSPSYHGYDVLDYRAINPDYGTMDDFRELLAEADARGIAVIMDLVINHTAVDHEWFRASAEDPDSEFGDWYVWAEEDPGYRGPDRQIVWHPLSGRYYYGVFWSGMPDLNYANPAVTEEMYDIAAYWLEEVGVDGFRLDAIKHIVEDGRTQENSAQTLAWMAGFHDLAETVKPDALLVGEVWSPTASASRYVNEQVDLVFEFDLAEALIRAGGFGLPNAVRTAVEDVMAAYPAGQYATFLANHDQNRTLSQLNGNVTGAKIAATVQLLLPGVPFIYYGEEIGMVGVKPDEDIRTPFQWSAAEDAGFTTGTPWRAVNADYTTVNVAAQAEDPNSLLNTYRTLIHLRNSTPALQYGDLVWVESTERKLLTFLRTTDEETVLVVYNMDDRAVTDYTLALASSGLGEVGEAELLLGAGEVSASQVSAPTLNGDGGFSDYVPLPELAPETAYVIRLN